MLEVETILISPEMKGDIMPEYQNYIMQILNTCGRFGCGEEYHERHHIVLRCEIEGGDAYAVRS